MELLCLGPVWPSGHSHDADSSGDRGKCTVYLTILKQCGHYLELWIYIPENTTHCLIDVWPASQTMAQHQRMLEWATLEWNR